MAKSKESELAKNLKELVDLGDQLAAAAKRLLADLKKLKNEKDEG